MLAYEQLTYQRYITILSANIRVEGTPFISLDLPKADRFQTEIDADGTIYLNYELEKSPIGITAPPQGRKWKIAFLRRFMRI